MKTCIGCQLVAGSETPPGGILAESTSFVMHQDPWVLIPGFFVITSKQHLRSASAFSKETFAEFSALLFATHKAIADLDFCEGVTVVQEERSSHFHYWLLPRHHWMDGRFDTSLNSIRPIMQYARATMIGPAANAAAADLAAKMKERISPYLADTGLIDSASAQFC